MADEKNNAPIDPSITQADAMLAEALEAGTLVKVKPWGKGQGDSVIVAAEDFDPALHKRLGPDPLDRDGDGRRGGSKPKASAK